MKKEEEGKKEKKKKRKKNCLDSFAKVGVLIKDGSEFKTFWAAIESQGNGCVLSLLLFLAEPKLKVSQ